MVLSRLDEDLFMKDTRYACTYFFEQQENLKDMLEQLMTTKTIRTCLESAMAVSMQFNENSGAIPAEYNQTVVKAGYEALINLACIDGSIPIAENGEKMTSGKLLLFSLMQSWFEVIDMSRDRKEVSFGQLFAEETGKRLTGPYRALLLGPGYDEDDCEHLFLPQMFIFWLRLLNIYDSAMKGQTVEDYMNEQQDALNDRKVSSMWSDVMDGSEGSDVHREKAITIIEEAEKLAKAEREKIAQERRDVEEGIKRAEDVKIGRPNERWVVDTSHENLYLELKNLWSERSKEFIERWTAYHAGKRSSILQAAKIFCNTARNGSIKNALLYCPELDADILCKPTSSVEEPSVTTSLPKSPSFLDVLRWILMQGRNRDPRNDTFIFHVAGRLQTPKQWNALPLIFACRLQGISAYCLAVVLTVLEEDLERCRRLIPGMNEQDLFSDEMDNFKGSMPYEPSPPPGKPASPEMATKVSVVPEDNGLDVKPALSKPRDKNVAEDGIKPSSSNNDAEYTGMEGSDMDKAQPGPVENHSMKKASTDGKKGSGLKSGFLL